MNRISYISLSLLVSCFLVSSCGRGVNVEHIPVDIRIQRFDKDLLTLAADSTQLEEMRGRYGDFFEYYNTGLIGIGNSRSPLYISLLGDFMASPVVKIAYHEVQSVFDDETALNKELTGGFKHLKYYFPDITVPQIYTYVSGFNESIMLTDSVIGVGLDRFLGDTATIYNQLDFSTYQQYTMRPDRIPVECLQAWLGSEYAPEGGYEGNLLQQMLYAGKIQYVNKLCFPNAADTLLFGFTVSQLTWCREAESEMWTALLENKELYNNNQFTIHKYIAPAPFTAAFSKDSPGRACVWLAYRIVEAYMKKHTVSLPELMQLDAQTLLKDSRYNP